MLNTPEGASGANLLIRNCTNATIDLLDLQREANGSAQDDIVVNNSTAVVRMRGFASGNGLMVYTFTNTVNFCATDGWYEPAATNYIIASGTGTFTIQGFQAAINGGRAALANWNGTALLSQGEIIGTVAPSSGTGSFWLNGVNFFNVTNLISSVGSLTTFDANNNRVQTNVIVTINSTNNPSVQISDSAALNTNLIRSTMSQVRSTKALQNPAPGSAVIDSVSVVQAIVSILIQ